MIDANPRALPHRLATVYGTAASTAEARRILNEHDRATCHTAVMTDDGEGHVRYGRYPPNPILRTQQESL